MMKISKIALFSGIFCAASIVSAADLTTNTNVTATAIEEAKLSINYTEGAPIPNKTTPGITVGELSISGYQGKPDYKDLKITASTGTTKGVVELIPVEDHRAISYFWTTFVNGDGAGININGGVNAAFTAATGNMQAGGETLYLKTLYSDTVVPGKYYSNIVVHLFNQ